MSDIENVSIPKKESMARAVALTKNCYDPETYEFDDTFRSYDPSNPRTVHTTTELIHCLHHNPHIQIDARVLAVQENRFVKTSLNREAFLTHFLKDSANKINLKEANFAADDITLGFTVGEDFTPLLGGPFFKNQYYYQDYIRMHSEAFFAKNNDPIANAVVEITRDFVVGTGFEVQCDTSTSVGALAMAAWRSFEEANNLKQQIDELALESSTYGESMFWWLPNQQTKIIYQLSRTDTIPVGMIPRVRLIDPSNIVEIVTYPEDVTRPLFYVWLTPTQYQIFTHGIGSNQAQSELVQPTLKFIYQQIPADQVMHFKINAMSNEKRGRSDLFPVFSYLKRLRDSVNFSLIALQKASAWAIDTEIDGDQSDVDNYTSAMAALGTIPPAGSEFAHTTKIKRQILASSGAGGVPSDAFSWCLSMIAAGTRIPVSYFGTHLSGGQTKASALVATEPVAKKMEKRREMIKHILKSMWVRLMKEAGIKNAPEPQIIFPEIITQDRSQKIKEIVIGEQSRYLKPETAAKLYAKEMGIQNYNYQREMQNMGEQLDAVPQPLSDPGKISPTMGLKPSPGVAGLTGQEKKDAKDADRKL